jgi:biopolymer transport protein ExbB
MTSEKFLAFTLLLASLISWGLILYKIYELWSFNRSLKSLNLQLDLFQKTENHSFVDFLEVLPLQGQTSTLIKPIQDLSLSEGQVQLTTKNTLENQGLLLEKGLSLLSIIASCAPFVGLLGTVLSIHQALINIPLLDQSSGIDLLVVPVGESLLMTAYGLAVAIPALFAHHLLSRSIYQSKIRLVQTAELLLFLRFDLHESQKD